MAQNNDWQNQIPTIVLLQHCKTMVKHGNQSNDSIIQTALKQIRFDIDLSDVESIDKIKLNIRNNLIRELPNEAQAPKLQRVMLKTLMSTLSKSNPQRSAKIYISTYSRDVKQRSMMLIRSTLLSIQKHADL